MSLMTISFFWLVVQMDCDRLLLGQVMDVTAVDLVLGVTLSWPTVESETKVTLSL